MGGFMSVPVILSTGIGLSYVIRPREASRLQPIRRLGDAAAYIESGLTNAGPA